MLQQRCFLLFLAMLALLVAMPFLSGTRHGRVIVNLFNLIVLVTAVAAVGRSMLSFVIALLLALPMLPFQLLALQSGEPGYFALTWGFGAAFYIFALAHLLHYVLRKDRLTADKLYGAVAAYMMIAILWALLYGVLEYFYPGAYADGGTPKVLDMGELIYFSFAVLTTSGFGDIIPVLIQSRFLAILEQVTGVMYVAILIARLTGVYPIVETKSWWTLNVEEDFAETIDLAAKDPKKLKELQDLFMTEAMKYNVIPIDDRSIEGSIPVLRDAASVWAPSGTFSPKSPNNHGSWFWEAI
jgi:hypothetical protein